MIDLLAIFDLIRAATKACYQGQGDGSASSPGVAGAAIERPQRGERRIGVPIAARGEASPRGAKRRKKKGEVAEKERCK